MDPKIQMPDIKAEVNKVDGGKKKATGLLGGLFGSGGSGAAGGLGGLGAGAAGGGGLLATKAGMLALVIVGSSVAGGIGLAGYKMFGPGEADQAGGNFTLFAPKPAQTADANGVAPVNPDGSSASLNYMSAAAAKDKAADAAAASAEAPADNTAGDAAKDAAAADAAASQAQAGTGGVINSGGGAGAAGSMGRGLTNTKKLGALSGVTSGGSTSAGSGSSVRLGENIANAAKNGATSGFSKGGPGAKASSSRGIASARGRNARTMLRNVGVDQKGGRAASSFAAGRTYDGAATHTGGAIGPDGSAIGMGGVGDGTGAQGKTMAANARGKAQEQEPPVPDGKAVITQFEKNIKMAQMLALLVVGLVMAANALQDTKVISWGTTDVLIKVIGAAIIAIGIKMAMLAGQILHGVNGEPGQKTPGTVVGIGAVLAIGVGVYVMAAMSSADARAKEKALADKAAADKLAAEAAQKAAAETAAKSSAQANFNPANTPAGKLDLAYKPPTPEFGGDVPIAKPGAFN